MKKISATTFLFWVFVMCYGFIDAQTATVKIDHNVTFQKITGFGGFVCSGTFQYGHMSDAEIEKLWGKNSEAGYNIMRLFIPVGEDSWSQSLSAAQKAQELGIMIFASPWSMPVEWKTNNNIAAKYVDDDGITHIGYLKEENYADYAAYLNDYVTYLRDNGVELEAISIQNEPDMESEYDGCIWTPQQIANFIKNFGDSIDCKIIAPESVGTTNNYAEALIAEDVVDHFDIFAGHQYGYIQDGLKQFQEKGMDVWMTEYLINWNADEPATRDFNWQKDAFNFAVKVNDALLANVNAWIHYASKRWYGLMGDGSYGTVNSEITKRGYILSHYAKFTTGTTRINAIWNDDSNVLKGSSYLSTTGDSIIVNVINSSQSNYSLTADLPFYTTTGNCITTSENLSMSESEIDISEETFRPVVNISASSVTTLIFVKSKDRVASQMKGEAVYYHKIDSQMVTKSAFGTAYQLSGKTATFDHSNNLISPNVGISNGYLQLDDRFSKLVFHIDEISSAYSYTSANTTLYYINGNGSSRAHNYGTVDFDQSGNYDWILDISGNVLTDGCTGILGISNGNWTSVLTISFGDVYFNIGNEKMYKFSGIYSEDDSYLIDCLGDVNYTSIDFTETENITSEMNWNAIATNKNCIFYVNDKVDNTNENVISGTLCNNLKLTEQGGDFYVPHNFTANVASYVRTFDGYGIMVLPFDATIPDEVKAYTLQPDETLVNAEKIEDNMIPANTPVLIVGTGTFTFEGYGEVSTPPGLTVNDMNGVYISINAPVNSYYLAVEDGKPLFKKVTAGNQTIIDPFSAYLLSANAVAPSLPVNLNDVTAIDLIKIGTNSDSGDNIYYDLLGRRVYNPQKGRIYINNGKKVVF